MPKPIAPQVSLRALREVLGFTLEQLAEAVRDQGVEITAVGLNNAELGHRRASEPLMLAWAQALGIKRHHIKQTAELRQWLDAVEAEEVSARETVGTAA